jgi:hypothetical protein
MPNKEEGEMKPRFFRFWLVPLILLTVAAGVAAVKMAQARLARAAAPEVGVTWTCSPDVVVSANVRVVAHCGSPYVIPGGASIFWFAYPTSDSGNASRMLSLFETAKATGSTVTFYFDSSDLSGAAYGCLNSDCRAIWAATTP